MAKSTTENPAEQRNAPEDVPAPAEQPQPQARKAGDNPTHVEYVGGAHVREIDAASWKSIGVEDQKKVVWDKRKIGGAFVEVSELSAGALEYLATDPGFKLVEKTS